MLLILSVLKIFLVIRFKNDGGGSSACESTTIFIVIIT